MYGIGLVKMKLRDIPTVVHLDTEQRAMFTEKSY